MKCSITAITIVILVALSVDAVAQTVGPLESISPTEFLKLPDGVRAIYVAGILDGMTFTSYNNSLTHHDQLVRCARSLTLGNLALKTTEIIRAGLSANDNMAVAVAKALGANCKEKGLR